MIALTGTTVLPADACGRSRPRVAARSPPGRCRLVSDATGKHSGMWNYGVPSVPRADDLRPFGYRVNRMMLRCERNEAQAWRTR